MTVVNAVSVRYVYKRWLQQQNINKCREVIKFDLT